jgi:hypothetical protein
VRGGRSRRGCGRGDASREDIDAVNWSLGLGKQVLL